jgi:hypothetical protein
MADNRYSTRFCLECKHFYFHPGDYGYSETPGWDARMGCKKLHWTLDLYGGDNVGTYREKVRSAEKCKDFEVVDDD